MKRYMPVIITAASVILLTVGIITGEIEMVKAKAITICLSCIGIG